jgi:nucleotide-binding universal stress UspA family protein
MAKLKARVPSAESVLKIGAPSDVIIGEAKRLGADLIVMGTHGRRGLSHVFLGSVAEKTLRNANVPVLVLHAPIEKKAG